LSLLISFGVFGVILKVNEINIISIISKIKIQYIFASFLLFLCGYLVDSIRLLIVSKNFEGHINFIDALNNNISGYFFSAVTPFAAGGQPYQIYHLKKMGFSTGNATNIVVSRFIVIMITNLIVSFASYKHIVKALSNSSFSISLIKAGLFASIIITLLIIFVFFNSNFIADIILFFEKKNIIKNNKLSSKFYTWSYGLKNSIKFLWSEKFHIMLIDIFLGLITIVFQALALYYMIHILLIRDHHNSNFFLEIFGGMTLLNMVIFYIPTPGGSGSIETTYTLLFGEMLGYGNKILASIFAWRFATYYLQIFFAGIFMFFYKTFYRKDIFFS